VRGRAAESDVVSGVKACIFDVYGTLLDLNGAIEPLSAYPQVNAAELLTLWRAKQIEYTWLRSITARYADFARINSDALDYACEVAGPEAVQLKPQLVDAFGKLPAYPDAIGLLRALRADGLKTAVLSNGTPAMLKSGLEVAGLLPALDAVLSVDSVGTYKPSPAVYRLPSNALGFPAEAMAFVSANAWDAAGAASAGLQVVWVNRGGAPRERLPDGPSVQVRSLADVRQALQIFGAPG
jgi:2-haloacid dehalogenase